jgi:hypothetical protein
MAVSTSVLTILFDTVVALDIIPFTCFMTVFLYSRSLAAVLLIEMLQCGFVGVRVTVLWQYISLTSPNRK